MAEPRDLPALLRQGAFGTLAAAVADSLTAGETPPAETVQAAMRHELESRRPAAAVDLWRAMAGVSPGFLPAQDLAVALDRALPGAAVVELLRAAQVPEGQPGQQLRLQRATTLNRLGAIDDARAAFREGIAIAPGSGHFALAALRRAAEDNDMPSIRATIDRVLKLPAAAPTWAWRFIGLFETGKIEIGTVTLKLPVEVVPPSLMLAFADGGYEAAEVDALARDLRPDDRLLDLGAGSGYSAIRAGLARPGLPILAVEANTALIPVITENLALNGVQAEVLHGIIGGEDGEGELALTQHFTGSSVLHPHPGLERLRLRQIGIAGVQARFRPTVISMDIEGAEATVIPALDLTALRRLVIELHPDLIGPAAMSDLLRRILDAGLVLSRAPERNVFVFARPDAG